MQGHIHTDFTMFVFAGLSAIVFINLMRFAAAHLVSNDNTEWLGRTLGALVTYP